MDKSLLIYLLIGLGFFYIITNFVGDLQEDDAYKSNDYNKAHLYDKYYIEDSVGQVVLHLSEVPDAQQEAAWHESPLKEEWLQFFPDFSRMKIFVDDRIEGEYLKKRLKTIVDKVEGEYFSGKVTVEKAKHMLGVFK